MKNTLLFLFLVLIYTDAISQDLRFEVRGTYTRSVTMEKLMKAESMEDLIPGYPSSWITDYISAEITTTADANVKKARGGNDVLNTEQKTLIQNADLGTDVVIHIDYQYPNSVTNQMEVHTLHATLTVVPEIEAQYMGGEEQLNQYLQENVMDKISPMDSKQIGEAIVHFTINEKGEIDNARISTTSGDEKIDKLLLKSITKMPKWKPAEMANGTKVSQEFRFSIGATGC